MIFNSPSREILQHRRDLPDAIERACASKGDFFPDDGLVLGLLLHVTAIVDFFLRRGEECPLIALDDEQWQEQGRRAADLAQVCELRECPHGELRLARPPTFADDLGLDADGDGRVSDGLVVRLVEVLWSGAPEVVLDPVGKFEDDSEIDLPCCGGVVCHLGTKSGWLYSGGGAVDMYVSMSCVGG